jgi:Nickel responsive protein SCO4226-like
MNKYIIERSFPGAGKISSQELAGITAKSSGVLRELGPEVQWVHTYITDDKLFCIFLAKNAELVREHAKRGGFPLDAIHEVRSVVDPASA